MMRGEFDLTIRINSEDARVVVEQRGPDGTVSTKNISPESLSSCIQNSRYDETECASGLLPEGCIGVKLSQNGAVYFIRYPDPSRLHTLAGYILRLPNSNDYYRTNHNQLHAEFRDLLEHMKDKTPEYYYSENICQG